MSPVGLMTAPSNGKRELNKSLSFKVKHFDTIALTKPFVQQFSSKDDDFFTQLFTLITLSISKFEKGVQLCLNIVANTNDPEIGTLCIQDTTHICNLFTDITNYLSIPLHKKIIPSESYNQNNIQKAIDELRPSP